MEETTHSAEKSMAPNWTRTWSDTEMDTEDGGQAGTSQLQSRCKKGRMINIYLTESAEHFKDKVTKECLLESFANSRKLSVKCTRPDTNPKGLNTENSPSTSLARLKRND